MVAYETVFNQNINNWNTSGVTSMAGMFSSAPAYNQPMNLWNVSNVTNMSDMFQGASSFNQDISSWNISNVTSMAGMFGASALNQDLSSWGPNVGSVVQMNSMFLNAAAFNQDLSGWCVTLIPTEPTDFATGATSWVLPKPVWGTCP